MRTELRPHREQSNFFREREPNKLNRIYGDQMRKEWLDDPGRKHSDWLKRKENS